MSLDRRGYSAIALHRPKCSANIGSALRAAGCYRADLVVISGSRISVPSKTDTQKAWKHIPTIQVDDVFIAMPHGATSIAVELCEDAHPLAAFVHPERAFYVFGPEDGSLPPEVLARCKYKVMIPTAYCMNLAATVNVILYDRMTKRGLA